MKFIDKEVAHHLLKDVPNEKHFVTKDGTKLKNLNELYLKVGSMHDKDFDHHVNEKRNDFANWVHHVVGDTHLAKKLHKSNSKNYVHKHLAKRVSYLNRIKNFVNPKGYGVRMFIFGLLIGYILGIILIYV